MRFPWRNKLAYVLLGVALLRYVLSGFVRFSNLNALRGQEMGVVIGWLTGPVTIIGWAAVVEDLSRIAEALQRRAP